MEAKGDRGMPKSPRRQQECDPQDPCDQRGPGYDNEVPVKSWLRGGGEDATTMPNFDHSPKRSPMKRRVYEI